MTTDCWIIERVNPLTGVSFNGSPQYFDGAEWSESIYEAIQFKRQEDGDRLVVRLSDTLPAFNIPSEIRITEHIFMDDGVITQPEATIDMLAMFVRRFRHLLKKYRPEMKIIEQSGTFLKAIGRQGSPLRDQQEDKTHADGN